MRENTSSGKLQEGAGHSSTTAEVAHVMDRAERAEKAEHLGVRFEIRGGNKAHHAKRTPGAEKW